MNLFLPNIGYNNQRDTQKLCLAYTKDTLKSRYSYVRVTGVVVVTLRVSVIINISLVSADPMQYRYVNK